MGSEEGFGVRHWGWGVGGCCSTSPSGGEAGALGVWKPQGRGKDVESAESGINPSRKGEEPGVTLSGSLPSLATHSWPRVLDTVLAAGALGSGLPSPSYVPTP